MPDPWTSLRRRLGVLFLLIAGCMIVLGFTWFETILRGRAFVVYWIACFLCTALAMLMALIDLRCIRKSARREQRELLNHVARHEELRSEREDA
ncbi:MAG: hypothetical protein FJ404_02195 [Verrucomicrobia bacterium]|nr:hypothetical protein [Verrucomicrobiota bacterium]